MTINFITKQLIFFVLLGLIVFYDISTLMGYLVPNPVHKYIHTYTSR